MTLEKNYLKACEILKAGKGLQALKKFKKLPTECKDVYIQMGNAYKICGLDKKAAECYIKADSVNTPFMSGVRIDKPYDLAQNNLGIMSANYGMEDKAMEYFNRALLYCDNSRVRAGIMWNMAHTLLKKHCSGKPVDIKSAWQYYDTRFLVGQCDLFVSNNVSRWNGEYVDKLVVLLEQGIGDRIMLGRYIAELEKRVGSVYVQILPGQEALFDNHVYVGEKVDVGVAFGSIPSYFDFIPNGEWLRHKYVEVPSSDLRIGIVATGSPHNGNTNWRNAKLSWFKRFSKYGKLYTLNPTEHCADFDNLGNYSWDETIKALGSIDLVISVDTSIVHLAGSMGIPCFVLMPYKQTDFRWGDDSMGYKNIWYDSVRVIRNPQSWKTVFDHVESLLYAQSKQR